VRGAKPIESVQAEIYEAERLSALGVFAAALAHEINQPLAAIANYAEAARQLAGTRAPEQMATIEAVLAKLDQQAARVASIVRSVREAIAARAQAAAAPQPRSTAPGPALGDALAVARVAADAAGNRAAIATQLDLAPDLPDAAITPAALALVVFHLARHTYHTLADRPRGTLTVAARRTHGTVEITVASNGPGMAPETVAALFQPLAPGRPGGLAIELAMCKAIVEAHDGRLWYEPGASGGAVFRFTLPIAEPATNDAEPAR
jgi:two-component system sensor kinase FixL